jgi:YfiH family protein
MNNKFSLLNNQKSISYFVTSKSLNQLSSIKKEYNWLNLWLHVWDLDEDVIKNREYLSKQVWKKLSDFVFMNQIHGSEVCIISEKDKWKGSLNIDSGISIDWMITNVIWTVLVVLVADCIPVLFYDKMKQVIWVAHAGWKWTEQKIVQNVIEKMKSEYNSNPSDILVCFWPSISRKSFEVLYEVAKKFDKQFYSEKSSWKYLLDLQAVNKKQLINSWILKENIEISNEDTFNNSNYFSARKLWYNSGRFWAWIFLK